MPATQRGQAYKLNSGKWGLRYYDVDGVRRRKTRTGRLHWPHRGRLKWPHFASVVVGVDVA
jgi:hypothetical protein